MTGAGQIRADAPATTISSGRLSPQRQRLLRKPGEKISQLGRRFSTAILPGIFLVDRREVIEGHAVELHLEQLVHRQLAARVGQADKR